MSDAGCFSVNKEYSKERDNDEETIVGKNSLPFNGCADSIVETVRLTFISWILFMSCMSLYKLCFTCMQHENNDFSE